MIATWHARDATLAQTLHLLESSFKSFADGIAEGRYAFWLGSGVSRDRFPMLDELVERLLEFLRSKANEDLNSPYRSALSAALDLAVLSDEERSAIRLEQPVSTWPSIDLIRSRLASAYDKLLDIEIGDLPNDTLVWEGIDIVGTYGDPAVAPDAEHYCLAILLREGVVPEVASANWDGLIEKAVAAVSDDVDVVSVCVKATDLQGNPNQPKLVKLHGCAIRARREEKTYRPLIVGRTAQLATWRYNPETRVLASHLETLVGETPTFMLGLSVQDVNIQNLFAAARHNLAWHWPGDRPSYVFGEDQLTPGQRALLKVVYGEQFDGHMRSQITDGSLIRAFAKPLLLALVLYVLCEKLIRFASTCLSRGNQSLLAWVRAGIVALRDMIADHDSGNRHAFTETLIRTASRLRRLATMGTADNAPGLSYEPLSGRPVSEIRSDLETSSNGLPQTALAAAILGQGVAEGLWTVEVSPKEGAQQSMASVVSGGKSTRLFVVANDFAEHRLYAEGRLSEEDDAVLVRAQPAYNRRQRSPRRAPGRTGILEPREVSIPALFADCENPDGILEQFKVEATL